MRFLLYCIYIIYKKNMTICVLETHSSIFNSIFQNVWCAKKNGFRGQHVHYTLSRCSRQIIQHTSRDRQDHGRHFVWEKILGQFCQALNRSLPIIRCTHATVSHPLLIHACLRAFVPRCMQSSCIHLAARRSRHAGFR